jgi:pyruvate dehydrogenase E1 component
MDQIDLLRVSHGLDEASEWDRFDPASRAGQWVARRREKLSRAPRSRALPVRVPDRSGVTVGDRPVSTQTVFGRILTALTRDPDVSPFLVTTAPDVAMSTNLGGFINRVGVFSSNERRSWTTDPVLGWKEGPSGQHIELGISEMNLFLLLGQLGLAWDLSAQPLLPIGTVYDPFVLRGLDSFVYSAYSGARFIVVGTPSGITLAPEGGAHQSTVTPSVGLELPNTTYCEPAYGIALDWMLCDVLRRMAAGNDLRPTAVTSEEGAYYFRLTTRSIDQSPFEETRRRFGDAILRQHVLAGAYRLFDPAPVAPSAPAVYLVGVGAVMPEVLAAAGTLVEEGVAAHVVDVTSPDRLYSAWQRTLRQGVRTSTVPSSPALRTVFPVPAPVVTVQDGASHAMAWLGSALGVPSIPLGVDSFGQSGTVDDLYSINDLLPDSIVNAAIAAVSLE